MACTVPAGAAAAATPTAGSSTSTTCGPDGQISMTQNTNLFYSQTPTPGHTVYSTTVITNKVGVIPRAEIRTQIIPEMQGATKQPPLPNIEWSLDGGAWHNPQVSWTTPASGDPYWLGPDLAAGTLTTGTHKIEVSFTFAKGDLYGAYGADVYVDADRCSLGGELSSYGDGYVDAAFDGPSSVAGSSGSGGSSSSSSSGKSGSTSGSSSSSVKGATTHSSTSAKSTPSSSTPKPTPSAAASASEPSTAVVAAGPSPSSAVGAQDVAVRNTAAASGFSTSATLGLILLAVLALGGFIALGRRHRVSAATADSTGSGSDESVDSEG
ncbi:hypothetical protein [Actinospica robiniae]|uniref:hypothetical protein n=1 Tax=Actinospica robiniae TaxID=304901 RepID=UPI00068694EB|nr:hypothetical protein [Actinospica robiniae]